MEAVLIQLEELLDNLINNRSIEQTVLNFAECFNKMSSEEKNAFLVQTGEMLGKDTKLHIFILSLLLEYTGTQEVVDKIDNYLENMALDFFDFLSLRYQFKATLFCNSIKYDKEKHYISDFKQYIKACDVVWDIMKAQLEYIPLNKRNSKHVILFIDPLLGERHSPTVRVVNLKKILENIGYDVIVISISYKEIFKRALTYWVHARITNSITDDNVKLDLQLLGEKIKGYHFEVKEDNFIACASAVCEVVKEFNPVMCIEVGDDNIILEAVRRITTVMTFPMTTLCPISTSDFYLCGNQEVKNKWQKLVGTEKEIMFLSYRDRLKPTTGEICDLDIDWDNYFYAIIIGNRLDSEITTDFLENMNKSLKKNPKLRYLIVGEIGKMESEFKKLCGDGCICVGYVDDLEDLCRKAHIYINPPRVGGGISARIALSVGMPIITKDGGDVAHFVGTEFVVESESQIFEELDRYCTDKKYYDHKCECAREIYKQFDNVDNEKNIVDFMEIAKAAIRRRENDFI